MYLLECRSCWMCPVLPDRLSNFLSALWSTKIFIILPLSEEKPYLVLALKHDWIWQQAYKIKILKKNTKLLAILQMALLVFISSGSTCRTMIHLFLIQEKKINSVNEKYEPSTKKETICHLNQQWLWLIITRTFTTICGTYVINYIFLQHMKYFNLVLAFDLLERPFISPSMYAPEVIDIVL